MKLLWNRKLLYEVSGYYKDVQEIVKGFYALEQQYSGTKTIALVRVPEEEKEIFEERLKKYTKEEDGIT